MQYKSWEIKKTVRMFEITNLKLSSWSTSRVQYSIDRNAEMQYMYEYCI